MRIATIASTPCLAAFLALALFLSLGVTTAAHAHVGIKIAFHAQTPAKSPPCTVGADLAAGTDCAMYTTDRLPLETPLYVYVVVGGMGGEGFTAAQFGITYDETPWSGVDIFDWMNCGNLDFPRAGPNGAWPAAGSANRIVWGSGCQDTVPPGGTLSQALAGVFYVIASSDDVLKATPDRTSICYGELKVVDCSLRETETFSPLAEWNDLGQVGFGASNGFTPCTGSFADPTICAINDRNLDFGTVLLGESLDLTFRIYASGIGPVLSLPSFDVGPLAGGDFTIVSGEGHYEGPVEDPVDVTIRFTPTDVGLQESMFEVDPCTLCPPVTLQGTGGVVVPVKRTTWGEMKTRYR